MNTEEKNIERELILREYDQVWEHFRYDAELRVKYLNFFFVVLSGLGAVIIAINQFSDDSISYIVWISLLLFASFYTTFTYINIIKHSLATIHYDRVLKELRRRFISKDFVKLITITYVKDKNIHKLYDSNRYSIQAFLLIIFFIFNAIIICMFLCNWSKYSDPFFLPLVLLSVIFFVVELITICKAPSVKYYEYEKTYIDPEDPTLPCNIDKTRKNEESSSSPENKLFRSNFFRGKNEV